MNAQLRTQYIRTIAPEWSLVSVVTLSLGAIIGLAILPFGLVIWACASYWIYRNKKDVEARRTELMDLSDDDLRTTHRDHVALGKKSHGMVIVAACVVLLAAKFGMDVTERVRTSTFHKQVVDAWNDIPDSGGRQSLDGMIRFHEQIEAMNAGHLSEDYQAAFAQVQTSAREFAAFCEDVPAEDDTWGKVRKGLEVAGTVYNELPQAPGDDAGVLDWGRYVVGVAHGFQRGKDKVGAPARKALENLHAAMQRLNAAAQSPGQV